MLFLKAKKLLRFALCIYIAAFLLSLACYLYFINLEYVPSWMNLGLLSVYLMMISWNMLVLSSCFLAAVLGSRLQPKTKAGEIPQCLFVSFASAFGILTFFEFPIGVMRPGGSLVGGAFDALSLYTWLVIFRMPDTAVSVGIHGFFRGIFPLILLSLLWLAFSLPYMLRGERFTFHHQQPAS